jgi:hypothetical protein
LLTSLFKSGAHLGPGDGRDMTDPDASGGAGTASGHDPAAGAGGQPLLVWLARLVGSRDPIHADDLFDGDLLARSLVELERRADGTAPGAPGDATADEVFDHGSLAQALDRAGLMVECAPAMAAIERGFNDWKARDTDAPHRILSSIYAHYLRDHARTYHAAEGGEGADVPPGDGAHPGADSGLPGDEPSPSLLSPTKPPPSSSSRAASSSVTRLSQSLTEIHPASPIKPVGKFRASPAEVKAANAARERAEMAAAAAAEAAAATGELLEEAASLRASLASLRASLTPSESEAMVVGETSNVARASMTGSFVPPPPSDDDEEEEGHDNTDPPMDAAEAGVLDALMAEARDDHLADVSNTSVSAHTRDEGIDGSESVVGSRELGRINLPSAESFDRSLSNSPASTPTTSPLRQRRGSRFSTSYSGEDDVGSSYDDATWQPSPSAAEAAQRDVLTQLAGLPLEDDDTDDLDEDDGDVTRTMVSSSVSSSVNASDFLLGTRGGGYDDGFVEDVAWEGSDVVLGSVQPSPSKQKHVASDLDLPSPPVKTPGRGGDVAARMVLDARKRQIEQVRAEEARAFGERRRAAGKEALMRFFASKKEAATASPTKRPSPTNTGVRRPLKLKSPNGPMGPTVASPVSASMETREAPLPRVATLKPNRGQWSREEPATQTLDEDEEDFAVPTEVSAHGIDPRAVGTPPGTTRRVTPRKPSPAIPQLKIPRVATHDPDAHRRSVTAAAALFNAEESVRAAAAYIDQQRSRLDVSSMDESIAGMPPRRSPAPLPKVAGFAPGQTRHAKVELGDGTGSADGGWGPGEPNDDSIVFDGANALGEVDALDAPPDAFPTWFGVVANETGEGIENVEPVESAEEPVVEKEWGVPGLATGAAGVHIPDHVLAAQLASPSAPPKKNANAPHTKNKSPKKKGEAMWVDLGAWDDASRVGIPSGAWGVGSEQMKKMAPRVGTSEVKKRSAAAAAEARERKMGALTAAIGSSNRQGAKPPSSLTSDPKLFRAASKLSNKKLVRNALCHVCLAGAANKANLDDALTALDAVAPDVATVFVILFRENTSPHKYRALYALVSGDGGVDDADARLVKIHGAGGPGSVGLDGVDSTMKYDSGTREFKPLATSGRLTPLTAAVTLVSRK